MSLQLFNDELNISGATGNLIRIKSTGSPLTTEQYTFNKLVKRIESLRRLIKEDAAKLDDINKVYQEKISPRLTTLGKLKIQLCHLLDDKRQAASLSQSQQFKLDRIICKLLEEGLSLTDPDPETEELNEKYNDELSETQQRFKQEEKELCCYMFCQQFGFHIDPTIFSDNPEFGEKQEEFKKQMNWRKPNKQRNKPKTKKQKKKELIEEQQQDLKSKKLRSIYVGLAELFSPDAEPDESLKLEKEELMKQVIIAYDKRDLVSLLKLEVQWTGAFKNKFDDMDINTLGVYTRLLRDQVKNLENEREMLMFQPEYAPIREFLTRSMLHAVHEINFEVKRLKKLANYFLSVIDQLVKGNSDYAVIQNIIDEYYPESDYT